MEILLHKAFRQGLLTGLMLAICFGAQAQQFDYHRDFQQILAQSQDSNSPLYYPQLLRRFQQNDSTLTDAEVLALQIGYTARQDYFPYKTLSEEQHIQKLVRAGKYKEALAACNQLLQKNPLNLTALMEKSFVSWKLGLDSLEAHRYKHLQVVSAVLASGDGSADQPFFILSPLDGQTLITQVLGGKVGTMGSSVDANDYYLDMLEFKKEGKAPVMLYFNIAHATARMFSEEEKAEIQNALEDEDVLSKSKKKQKN